MFVAEFNSVITPPQSEFFSDPPDPVFEAEMRQQMLAEFRQQLVTSLPTFAFPASLARVASNFVPVTLLAIYLAIALVAGEFEWGTVRPVHLTSSRGRTLAVRVGVVLGLVGVAIAVGLLLAAIIPFFLTAEGRPLQDYAAPVPDLLGTIAIRLLIVVPFVAIPVLMAVLTGSTGAAFLLTLLLIVADSAVTGAPIWSASAAQWVPALTLTGSITRLLGGPDTPLASVAPAWLSMGALIAWAVVPVLAAIARFRRLDINE
jgi:ABC-type transport system involved in multi-copper enzyme maturation permease subunit